MLGIWHFTSYLSRHFSVGIMAKATPKKQNSRADPISKKGNSKGKETKPAKDPKAGHLYTDDTPETTLHGTGFKDAATANKTSMLFCIASLASTVKIVCPPEVGPWARGQVVVPIGVVILGARSWYRWLSMNLKTRNVLKGPSALVEGIFLTEDGGHDAVF